MSTDPDPENQKQHSWLRVWAEISGAWAISLAYPVYSNIASGPEALTSYGLRRPDLLILIVLVSLLGPLLIMLAELAIRRLFGEQPRRIVHGVVIGALLSLVVWQWLLGSDSPALIRNLLPLLLAGLIAWLYVRTELVRNFVLIFSLATVVVIGAFCLDYPIRDEVFPHEAAASTGEIEGATPVVVVVFDELPLAALETPDGRIDPRFRNFAMLARKASWYPGALSVADQTNFALPSILAGAEPDHAGGLEPPSPGLANYPDSICRIAEDGGYEVHAYEPITDLCPRSWGVGSRVTGTIRRAVGADDDPPLEDQIAPGDLDRRVARAIGAPFDLPYSGYDEDRRKAFDDFIDGLPAELRSLSVLHIALPHVQWMFLPDGKSYPNFRSPADNQLVSPDTQPEVDRDAQQMMLQLRYTDRELGRLIRKMKENGTWDASLFVVTADHGAGFQVEGSRRIFGSFNSGWIVPVPLFIKFPGQERGRVVKGTVDGRSIAPTVLSGLGLDPPDGMEGADLTGLDRLPAKKRATMVGTIGGDWEIETATVRKERLAASRYLNGLFGRSFYAPVGHPELIGKPPGDLSPVPFAAEDPAPYGEVDAASDQIPAYFGAALSPPGNRDPGPVAIALNGTVVATARPWQDEDLWKVGVVLPASGFRDGSNRIGVHEIGTSR